jgi:hypothetical protein
LVDQQKRRRYLFKKLIKRGVRVRTASKAVFSNKGRWALSNTYAVNRAYPNRWFIHEMNLRVRTEEQHPHWLSIKTGITVA